MDFDKYDMERIIEQINELVKYDYSVQHSEDPAAMDYDWYKEYRESIDSGNLDKTIAILKRVMKESPELGLPYFYYGSIYTEEGGNQNYYKALYYYLSGARECELQKTMLLGQAAELAFLKLRDVKMAVTLFNKAILTIGKASWGKPLTISYLTQERIFQFLQIICDNLGFTGYSLYIKENINMVTYLDYDYQMKLNNVLSGSQFDRKEVGNLMETLFPSVKLHIQGLLNSEKKELDTGNNNNSSYKFDKKSEVITDKASRGVNNEVIDNSKVNISGIRWVPVISAFVLINIVVFIFILPLMDALDEDLLILSLFIIQTIAYFGAGIMMGYWIGERPIKELIFVILANTYTTFKGILRGEFESGALIFLIIGIAASYAAGYLGGILGVKIKKRRDPEYINSVEKERKKEIINDIQEDKFDKEKSYAEKVERIEPEKSPLLRSGFWKDIYWKVVIVGFFLMAVLGITSVLISVSLYPSTDTKYLIFLFLGGISVFIPGFIVGYWTGRISFKEIGIIFTANFLIPFIILFGDLNPKAYVIIIPLYVVTYGFILFASYLGSRIKNKRKLGDKKYI